MKYTLFPKFFAHLSLEGLMEKAAAAGLDGVSALVREGYWLTEKGLAAQLPAFVTAAEKNGLGVFYADTAIDPAADAGLEQLRILAANGVGLVRVGYLQKSSVENPRQLADKGKALAAAACEAGQRCGVRCVIQLHGDCYPHNATAAWELVKNLDPRYVGIQLDPGNNHNQEGYEHFPYQVGLLGEYIAAVGVKDSRPLCLTQGQLETYLCRFPEADRDKMTNRIRSAKGWTREFAPLYEGMTDLPEFFGELKKIGFNGPAALMPFYEEDNFSRLYPMLCREVAYVRGVEKEIWG